MIVGSAICKLGEDALVHKRYEEGISESNAEKTREQIADELAEIVMRIRGASVRGDDNDMNKYIDKAMFKARQWLKMREEE